LCWSRSGEVIGARWDEFNLTEKIWTIPGERTKAGKPHRVPLCARAMQILEEMQLIRDRRPSEFVFQGAKDGQPLSNMSMLMLLRRMGHVELTTHGFRAPQGRSIAAELRFGTS
jgi:integrase